MTFLQIKRDTIYLNIESSPKPIRPLAPAAVGKFVYSIPSCSQIVGNTKKDLRRFTMLDTDFSRWLRDNPDPLWEMLDVKDKFDNRDNKRQDFPVRPQHIIPVWSYMDNDVKVVKQGNQFYDEMTKYDEAGGQVTECDWMCWAEGSGMSKKYKTSRLDKSQFVQPIDPNLMGQKVQALVQQALSDLRPFKTEEDMMRYIYGHAADETASLPGQNPQAQIPAQTGVAYSMPAYVPGGTPQIQHGAPPIPQQQPWTPPVQQQVQQPWQQPVAQPQQPQQPWTPPTQPPLAQAPQQPWIPPVQSPQQQWAPPVQQQQWTPPTQPLQQPWTPPAQQQWTPPVAEVPNAPVTSQPVFAPPAQPPQQQVSASPPGTPPAQVVVTGGKHAGKTLGWIKDNDHSYLSFLKGNRKELAPMIEALMGGMSAPAQSPQGQPVNPDAEVMRSQLVKEINQKIMTIPEFQGPGVMTAMMPFLQQTIGTTKFSDAPIDQLQTLKMAVDSKMAPRT